MSDLDVFKVENKSPFGFSTSSSSSSSSSSLSSSLSSFGPSSGSFINFGRDENAFPTAKSQKTNRKSNQKQFALQLRELKEYTPDQKQQQAMTDSIIVGVMAAVLKDFSEEECKQMESRMSFSSADIEGIRRNLCIMFAQDINEVKNSRTSTGAIAAAKVVIVFGAVNGPNVAKGGNIVDKQTLLNACRVLGVKSTASEARGLTVGRIKNALPELDLHACWLLKLKTQNPLVEGKFDGDNFTVWAWFANVNFIYCFKEEEENLQNPVYKQWIDYLTYFGTQVLKPVVNFQSTFPAMRKRRTEIRKSGAQIIGDLRAACGLDS